MNINDLLLYKQLAPLSQQQIDTLQHIQDYNVEAFNESEVRSYIVDPMLRVLGYDKGTPFSTNLEQHLYFLGQKRRSDYHITLWEENFWLIEAKRPQKDQDAFGYDDFSQALEYSVHPKVNAALIVLCDGLKLEIFDREENVDKPFLHIDIKNLVADFDKVRAILEPMQIWFFQKRRVLRLIDRVFDKEFVMSRVDEFAETVDQRLKGKRNTVVQNFRAMIKPDSEEQRERAAIAPLADLSESYMMFDCPIPIDNAVNRRLVELSEPSSFQVMHRIFPDRPRRVNDSFIAQAVMYLMALEEKRQIVEWMPAWIAPLKQGQVELKPAIQFLLDQCLTYFKDYEPYQLILLAANAAQRIAKILAISNNAVQKLGADLHALARFTLPEISWAQVVASPESQLIGIIDAQTSAVVANFVSKNSGPQRSFQTESAKLQLKGFWEVEKRLLAGVPNYSALLKERSLGEMRMIEWASVTYDNLGHLTLCRLHRFPAWRDYLLRDRRGLVETVAATGSWAARKMLGLDDKQSFRVLSDQELADRFFLGDVDTMSAIRAGYKG